MPEVSIIIPLYNKAPYIGAAIDSVLAQTINDWELWVVDNGSTDGGEAIAREYAERDNRVNLIDCPLRTGGPGAPRNFALNYAMGNWLLFFDADDLLMPNYLEQQLATVQLNPKAEIIVGSWQEFTDDNPNDRLLKHPSGLGQPSDSLSDSAIAFAPWAVHAALVKRSIITSDLVWPEEMDYYLGEDIVFWFKLISQCQVAYSESSGALYRTQTDQCRTQNQNPEKWFTGIHAAIELNQTYWQHTKGDFTGGQCECLMRVYSEIYLLAQQHQSISIQIQSLQLAEKWLDHYFKVEKNPKFPMLFRRLLGIPITINMSLILSNFKKLLVSK